MSRPRAAAARAGARAASAVAVAQTQVGEVAVRAAMAPPEGGAGMKVARRVGWVEARVGIYSPRNVLLATCR